MLIRNLDEVELIPPPMAGARGTTMAVMVGRADGAPNFAMRQVRVEAGGYTPRHQHDYEHEVLVLDGQGTVLLDGAERPIRAGDVVFVPANEEHQFKALGETPLRFVCLVPATRDCGAPTPGS